MFTKAGCLEIFQAPPAVHVWVVGPTDWKRNNPKLPQVAIPYIAVNGHGAIDNPLLGPASAELAFAECAEWVWQEAEAGLYTVEQQL